MEDIKKSLVVDVMAYNSKFYYVITDGGGYGEQVYPIQVTGNETVLDALAKINGLPPVASKKRIWVARATADCDHPMILPVDWCGITQRGCVITNYQIFPNDRIYVASDPWIRAESYMSKWLNPVDRVLGYGPARRQHGQQHQEPRGQHRRRAVTGNPGRRLDSRGVGVRLERRPPSSGPAAPNERREPPAAAGPCLREMAMSRFFAVSLGPRLCLSLADATASAQTPPPYVQNRPSYGVGFRPRLSPYLDLANGGDPAVNYYLGTLPEYRAASDAKALRRRHQRPGGSRPPAAAGRRRGRRSVYPASPHRPCHGVRQHGGLFPAAAVSASGAGAVPGRGDKRERARQTARGRPVGGRPLVLLSASAASGRRIHLHDPSRPRRRRRRRAGTGRPDQPDQQARRLRVRGRRPDAPAGCRRGPCPAGRWACRGCRAGVGCPEDQTAGSPAGAAALRGD